MAVSDDLQDLYRVRRRRRLARETPAAQARALFGAPPLLPGEDELAYLELAERLRTDMAPVDMLQQILVRDIIDLTWQINRLQGVKASYLRWRCREAAIKLIAVRDSKMARDLARKEVSLSQINAQLRRLKISQQDVNAHAVMENMEALERVERQIALLSARRDSLHYEFDQRREAIDRWKRRERALDAEQVNPAERTIRTLPKPAAE